LRPGGRLVLDYLHAAVAARHRPSRGWEASATGGFWAPGPHLLLTETTVEPPVLAQRIKSAAHASSRETPYEIIRDLGKARLLVVDDLGKESGHEWDKSILVSVFWQAWDARQLLLVTTQLKLRALGTWLGDGALASRLDTLHVRDLGQADRRAEAKP
jgi:hypothetical protein